MLTVKEKIIKGIQNIHDEDLLLDVYILLQDIQDTKKYIKLNTEQKTSLEEAREDYKQGRYHSTDDLFKEMLNE
ncbi:MAG TPA: hypothetical protein VK590_03555 [Saprospiraceae bacterium]|nr:hypothetical protein [Saprospiraceae bacterium]